MKVARMRDRAAAVRQSMRQQESARGFKTAASDTARPVSGLRALVPVDGFSGSVVKGLSTAGQHIRELVLDPHFKAREAVWKFRHWRPASMRGEQMYVAVIYGSFGLAVFSTFVYIALRQAANRERMQEHLRRRAAEEGHDGFAADLQDELRQLRGDPSGAKGKCEDEVLLEMFMPRRVGT
eukprot:TRINITY_DN3642_c5_g1_i2.p1 TRINITY_DN3642_c5_g1~~TRINITY_DN3642_c5_g1_i2.p1  ORF type:complete len:181 (+),score=56.49 TRINITY_DN3642_c5_g1_i2:467-1009(+)